MMSLVAAETILQGIVAVLVWNDLGEGVANSYVENEVKAGTSG